MIVLGNRRPLSERILPYAYPFAIGLFVVALLCLLFFFLMFRQKTQTSSLLTGSSSLAHDDFEEIGRGVLDLHRPSGQELPDFSEELTLQALNTRPDAKQMEEEGGQPRLLFRFRGNPIPILARSGQTLYLSWEKATTSRKEWNGPPSPISVSHSPTPWKIEPLVIGQQAFIAASAPNETLEILVRKTEEESAICQKPRLANWLKILKAARFWTTDRFLSSYSQTPSQQQLKIGFGKSSAEKVLVITPGQHLFFASGEWQQGSLEQAKRRPLAQLVDQGEASLIFRVWDESGFYHETVTIPALSSEAYSFTKMESLFSALKARNNSEISSVMGKRRIVLKPGDWWIKTCRGWRRLKKRNEIEDYVSFRLLGELFVMDALETFQGRAVMKGYQFDPLRQHMQPFLLPIAEAPGHSNKTYPSTAEKPAVIQEKKSRRAILVPREHKEKSSP
ncbi:MAG: hypothetical protein KGZ39_06870 [Simkania sp.]|nr:hypothetical protein [Simkania sp.]